MSVVEYSQETTVSGVEVLVNSLRTQGVSHIFGIVGIPIVEVAVIAQQCGIQFIGMRNEQAACYAAQAMGYLTGQPAVCLVVSGPGLLHTVGGLANAKENSWPLVVLGGSSDTDQEGCGAFQEWPQVDSCRLYCKSSVRPASIESIPYIVYQSFKKASYGRPGPVYIDLPGDMLNSTVNEDCIKYLTKVPTPPLCLPDFDLLEKAASLLEGASCPLIIVGKGAAYSGAHDEIRELVTFTKIPFLPTPMGKGTVPDSHPLCVAAARSLALRKADLILLVGARLNWITHFGRPPRFRTDCKFIQIDICPEEFHSCIETAVPLHGNIRGTVKQLVQILSTSGQLNPAKFGCWIEELREKIRNNEKMSKLLVKETSIPLSYYAAFGVIQQHIPDDCIIVSEGANTMDIGRAFLQNNEPRHRLDAGTFGTMGVGLGYAIAAALWAKGQRDSKHVVCVEGDSAFGFSSMEVETMYRYQLPVIIVVFNNSGIYGGLDQALFEELKKYGELGLTIPPTSLLQGTRYDKMAGLFDDLGIFCQTPMEIEAALKKGFGRKDKPTIINIEINPTAQRKAQDFDWLTRSKL